MPAKNTESGINIRFAPTTVQKTKKYTKTIIEISFVFDNTLPSGYDQYSNL
jgi:hypothetical protein